VCRPIPKIFQVSSLRRARFPLSILNPFMVLCTKILATHNIEANFMRILIAEDDPDNARLLEVILKKNGFSGVVEPDGKRALTRLRREKFDILLTDWMMPEMDGIELIRSVRKEIRPSPLIIMITAIDTSTGRDHALRSGADDFLTKPYKGPELIKVLRDNIAKFNQAAPVLTRQIAIPTSVLPPFPGVAVASSTGGPDVLVTLFKSISPNCNAGFFVVQHGPKWMLEVFADRLHKNTGFNFELAKTGVRAEAKKSYLAPGDQHLCVEPGNLSLKMNNDPQENFVRPAADPLFRSVASVFGKYSLAVVMTGMGRDGAKGAAAIKSAGGRVLVQDPDTAVAVSMPKTVVELGLADEVLPLEKLGAAIERHVMQISGLLKIVRKAV
jgi:two-component system chemotaxis response regulator CheB